MIFWKGIGLLVMSFVFAGFFLIPLGCQFHTEYAPPIECNESNSIILDITGGDPRVQSLLLEEVNLQLVVNDAYTAKTALQVMDEIEKYAESGVSLPDIAYFVIKKFDSLDDPKWAVQVSFFSETLSQLMQVETTARISECDLELIKRHLEKQRKWMRMLL